MRLHILKLHSVPHDFHLVVCSAEVMKYSGGVLISQIARQIPANSFDHRETRRCSRWIVEVTLCHLLSRKGQLACFAYW
jgi:hypothetical protein